MIKFLQKHLQCIAKPKRYLVAARDAVSSQKDTYAQNGEDRFVFEALRGYDLTTGMYVDVGANQPTQISNTYLFYRTGLRGVVIEPNRELIPLFLRFRPRDVAIPVGCADRSALLEFKHTASSDLSTFDPTVSGGVMKSEFLPVLPLDEILVSINFTWIYYLSIDAEGFDLLVLKGAEKSLTKTFFVSVEFKGNRAEIIAFLRARDFVLVHETRENLIFRNSKDFTNFEKRR